MTRKSEAALAWISRVNDSRETEFLTQWNHNWNAYSLIGGHVESGESFHQGCSREIEEELLCTTSDYELAPNPFVTLRFREFSKAACQETDYDWQIFLARPTTDLLGRLPADCQWVQSHHIRSGLSADGKPIADQVRRVLKAVNNEIAEIADSVARSDSNNANQNRS